MFTYSIKYFAVIPCLVLTYSARQHYFKTGNKLFATLTYLLLLLISTFSLAFNNEQPILDYKRPSTSPFPTDNPYNFNKAALGKMLFFDPRLSKNENISCSTCHNPSFGWEGGNALNVGSQNTLLARHSPTIINTAWGDEFFWDGRAKTLEEQALGPIQDEFEMQMNIDVLVMRLKGIEGYQRVFKSVFDDGITAINIAKAIATFERTIVSGESPFDKWVAGQKNAISASAQKGFILFTKKGKCSTCHTGWNFTDNKYHDIGISTNDIGRFALDSSSEKNRYAFKTPSLRNIAQRAPYMHDGQMKTLNEVIVHYITGGIKRPSLSDDISPIPLTADEIRNLVDFLNTLQGKDKEMPLPTLPL